MKRSGFTLIELMIVMAIIAALAAILTPIGVSALNRAKATQYLSDLKNIQTAVTMYHFDKPNTAINDITTLKTDAYLNTDNLTNAGDYALSTYGTTSSASVTIASIVDTDVVKQLKNMVPNGWEVDATKGEVDFTF